MLFKKRGFTLIEFIFKKLIGTDGKQKAIDLLKKEVGKHKRKILGGGALIILGACMVLPIPFLMKFIMDSVIPDGNIRMLVIAITAMTVIHLLKSFQDYFTRMLFFKINNWIIIELRRKLFQKLNVSDMLNLKKYSAGYLISRLEKDPRHLQSLFGEKIITLAKDAITFLAAAAALLYINWRLSVLIFIVVAMILWVVIIYGRKIKKQSEETFERMAINTKSLEENLNLIETCKIFSRSGFNLRRYTREMFITFRSMIKLEKLNVENRILLGLISSLIPIVILGYGGYEMINGAMSVGSLMAFMMFLGELMGPASSILGFNIELQEIKVALQRINEILELPEEEGSSEEMGKVNSMEFRNISFAYENGGDVIKDFNFKANQGDTIGIIGKSGAGKTTLMNIIAGLYDFKGDVLVNDKIAILNTLKPLRHKVSVVNQEPFLFNDTISANVSMAVGKRNIEKALGMSCSNEFVDSLEEGECTVVGEKGNRLSVGQKQRLTIARALHKESDILIFDEPTASVDKDTSKKIIDIVKGLANDKIVFIIAHKYESVKYCNKIVALEDGVFENIGNYENLIAKYKKGDQQIV